jgi:uncharacterized cupin superfamily protein
MDDVVDSVLISRGEAEKRAQSPGEPFGAVIEDLSDFLELSRLGVRRYHVEPGDRAWPFHAHLANEELIIIEEGQGQLRVGDRRVDVVEGDVIGFPAEPGYPHQLINDAERSLVYLCVSTMREPDVTLYPDSDKIGVLAGEPPGGESDERTFEKYLDDAPERDYWDGELTNE